MAEMSGQGANQRGFDEHYKNTKKVTVYFYSTANDIPVRVSSSNPLPVSATIDTTGLATTTTDTNTTAISTNIGAKADASATTDTGTFSLISLFKRLLEKVTTLNAKDFSTETTLSALNTKLPAQGQALAAASTPVVLPAAQITTLTPPAAITGFATSAKQDTLLTELQLKADLTETQPVSLASVPTHAVTQSGTWTEANSAAIKTAVETIDNAVSGAGFNITQFAGTNNAVGSGTATGALRVELPTNGTGTVGLNAGTNAIGKLSANSGVDIGDVDVTSTVLPTGAGTSSVTSVADTTTSATLIASNSARKEVIITNDSSATLYVKYGTTASSTNYTVSLDRGDSLFEDRYTGRVDGIWATDPNDGAARITEIT